MSHKLRTQPALRALASLALLLLPTSGGAEEVLALHEPTAARDFLTGTGRLLDEVRGYAEGIRTKPRTSPAWDYAEFESTWAFPGARSLLLRVRHDLEQSTAQVDLREFDASEREGAEALTRQLADLLDAWLPDATGCRWSRRDREGGTAAFSVEEVGPGRPDDMDSMSLQLEIVQTIELRARLTVRRSGAPTLEWLLAGVREDVRRYRTDTARAKAALATKRDPDSAEAQRYLEALERFATATKHAQRGQNERAERLLLQVAEVFDFPPAHYGLGSLYGNRGSLGKSVDQFTRAIELQPEHGPAYMLRALSRLRKFERDQLALSDVRKLEIRREVCADFKSAGDRGVPEARQMHGELCEQS